MQALLLCAPKTTFPLLGVPFVSIPISAISLFAAGSRRINADPKSAFHSDNPDEGFVFIPRDRGENAPACLNERFSSDFGIGLFLSVSYPLAESTTNRRIHALAVASSPALLM
jgi:hypothetical protein